MMTEKELLDSVIGFLESNDDIRERYQIEIEKFKQQREQAKLDRCRLGVIGVTSSGKSTMINAVMKEKFLTMAVQPSSSQLVTCSKSEQLQVTVYFKDKPPITEFGKNVSSALKKYGDERYNPGNKYNVKQLEVSSPGFAFPEEVLLIDSPGLDAYGYEGHEKLTLNSLLPTIDFCIFVTTCKTNSDAKMKSVLDVIAEYDCPLIIVQNMIDSLKPSPDGKKSVAEVAAEHRGRIERIVKLSGIKDKNIIIVQMSAKWALEAFTEKKLPQGKRKNYIDKSNFNGLVTAVSAFFSKIRPNIEYHRLCQIGGQIKEIVGNAKKDINTTVYERKTLTFEYEGDDDKIEAAFYSAQSKLGDIIQKLKRERDNYSTASEKFTDDVITKIKDSTKKAERDIIDTTTKFRTKISKYCERYNVDARNLQVLGTLGLVPGLRIEHRYEPKKVKKKGFGQKVARFFGSVFGNDNWGYEKRTTEVYDHEKTRKNVIDYYDRVISLYCNHCDKWEDSAENQTNELLSYHRNAYEAYEARKQSLLDKEKMKTVILSLENLLKEIPEAPVSPLPSGMHPAVAPRFDMLHYVRLDKCTYAVIKLADKLRLNIHRSVFKAFTGQNRTRSSIVIGWDSDSTAMFLRQNLCVDCTGFRDGTTYLDELNLRVFMNPSAESISTLKRWAPEERDIFILFNATQFGAGLKQVDRSGLGTFLTEKDHVYFVVQDLAEIITGGNISEGIANMFSIGEKLSLKVQYRIMLNHTNPVYNMAAAELQTRPCTAQADEVTLLNDIQHNFPYLRDPQTDKYLHEIISCFKPKKQSKER